MYWSWVLITKILYACNMHNFVDEMKKRVIWHMQPIRVGIKENNEIRTFDKIWFNNFEISIKK